MGKTYRDSMCLYKSGRNPRTHSNLIAHLRAMDELMDEGFIPNPRIRTKSNPASNPDTRDDIEISAWGEVLFQDTLIKKDLLRIASQLGYEEHLSKFKHLRPDLLGLLLFSDYYIDSWGLRHTCGVMEGKVLAHMNNNKVLYSVEMKGGLNTHFMDLSELLGLL